MVLKIHKSIICENISAKTVEKKPVEKDNNVDFNIPGIKYKS